MKKHYLFMILLANLSYSQVPEKEPFKKSEEIYFQMSKTASANENVKYSEIQGSVYFPNNFVLAKAICCNETAPMRYDTYSDQIEYQKDGTTYILLKDSPFLKIEFQNNTTFILDEVSDGSGLHYFVLLVDGKNSLLKKISSKIESNSEEITTISKNPNTYSNNKDKFSKFKANPPIFYLKTEKGSIELKGKKEVYDLYSNKSAELDHFFNSNKINFNKESSLIKLVNFLNTVS